MPDLTVIVPSRGRPEAAVELADTFALTCKADTQLVFAVDVGSGDVEIYDDVLDGSDAGLFFADSHNMVESLNYAATFYAGDGFALGFMGDDHRPRTMGWDALYLEELHKLGTGIVYGNDLLQGHNLPTQCAMTSNIVTALGYMAPPALTHMYVDNFWLMLGRTTGCIRYLPNVVVEHMHPLANKALWSEGHKRVNAQEMYEKDHTAFNDYLAGDFVTDVAKIRGLL